MLKRTPLFETHRECGARLVDFGGWEMPLHYGSQLEEHHAVRRGAGMFDVSHMLAIDVAGANAKRFLSLLLANDIARLTQPGTALYTCMLNERGGIVDDLIVYFLGPDAYRLVVNAGTAETDLAWIGLLRDEAAVDVELMPRRDVAMIAIQGPSARAAFWQACPDVRPASEALGNFKAAVHGQWLVARTGYTGEDGFEVTVPASEAAALWRAMLAQSVKPCGLGARDTLRLEAGMNLYGQDMDETVTPMEAGLGWTVDMRSGRAFVGREALAASRPRFGLGGLVLRERGVLRAHQHVHTSQGDGEVTSGTFSPTLSVSIAMARLPLGVNPGEDATVDVRGRHLTATAVKYPFVRHGQTLIDKQLISDR